MNPLLQNFLAAFATFSVLVLTGCYDHSYDRSDIDENDGSRIFAAQNTAGIKTALSGTFSLHPTLIPKEIKITAIDEDLKEIETYKATIRKKNSQIYSFSSDSSYYPTPYAKISFTCTHGNSKKDLYFEEYVDFSKYPSPNLNLLGALESKRVMDLVQKDGFYLSNAKKKASREIFNFLGIVWQEGIDFESDSIKYESLRLMPYLIAKYDESDSAFIENFDAISASISQNDFGKDFYDSIWIADNALLHYQGTIKKSDNKSFTYFASLWENVYGLPKCDSLGKSARIKNERSALNQSSFVCDLRKTKTDSTYFWKLLDSLDIVHEPCRYGYKQSFLHNDTVYTCSSTELAWIPADGKTALDFLYGTCQNQLLNKTRAYHDTIFWCTRDYKSFRWTDTIPEEILESADFERRFFEKYGDCNESREKEKAELDAQYFQCHKNKWETITELGYATGDSCNTGDTLRLPSAKYFRCRNNQWDPISVFNYYGISCSKENANDVAYYDSIYYWCRYNDYWERYQWDKIPVEKQIPPVLNQDTCRNMHVLQYDNTYYICKNNDWQVLPSSEAIPPIINEDICGELTDSTYTVYDGKYYFCEKNKWKLVSKDEVSAPVLAGDSCTTSNKTEVRKYGNQYFTCLAGENKMGFRISNHWSPSSQWEIVIYERTQKRGDYCAAGQVGTTLEWDESTKSLLGCVKNVKGDAYEWAHIIIGDMDTLEQKNFANGEFKQEGIYQCDYDGNHYEFDRFFWNDKSWKDFVRLRLERATIGGVKYDAKMVNGKMYIRAPYGAQTTALIDYEPKSESYDEFYKRWNRWANVKGMLKLEKHDDNTFTTWDEAKNFCPAGFHIPDTTEWKNSDINKTKRTIDSDESNRIFNIIQGATEINSSNSFERILVLVWSSIEKDEDTQYCYTYEVSSYIFHTNAKTVFECPKDLKPFVQAMCVRD